MDIELDDYLGADADYQAARTDTAHLLRELRSRLEKQNDAWNLVVQLEEVLQAQVILALDIGARVGKKSR